MATESRLQIVIDAQNNAEKAFKQLSKDMADVSKRFETESKIISSSLKYATVGVAALATGVTAFGVSSFNAFRESQTAMARFSATLATTGKAGIKAKDQLLAAADAAVKLGFDDEDTAESLAKFFQRTNDVTQSLKLNQVAMDLARAKNIELSEASKMVNLVLSGNGKALKEYGIVLKEGTTPLQALSELQTQVAGQSDAFTHTVDGSMKVLGVTFGNLQESIGGALSTAIQPALEGLAKFAQTKEVQDALGQLTSFIESNFKTAVENITTKIKEWYESVGGVDGIKAKLTDLWKVLTDSVFPALATFISLTSTVILWISSNIDWIWKLVAAYEALKILYSVALAIKAVGLALGITTIAAGPLLIGGAVIIGLVAAAILVIKNWDALKSKAIEIGKSISGAFSSMKDTIFNAFADIGDWIIEKLKPAIDFIGKLISGYNKIADKTGMKLISELNINGKATGGPVISGNSYLVGENGPEMFTPAVSGSINNSPGMGKNYAPVFNFTFNGDISDKDQLIREITGAINRRQELYSIGAL